MARSKQEIYDNLVFEKESYSELNGLNSISNTAIFRLIFYVVAQAIYMLEVLFDFHTDKVNDIIETRPFGTANWYVQQLKNFQYSESLVLVDNYYVYETIDDSKKIIKAVAINETSSGELLIKVAKEASGELTALSTLELDSAKSFIDRIKPPGVITNTISLNADRLKIEANFYYDAQNSLLDI